MVLSLAGCTQKESRSSRQTTKEDGTESTETEDTETSGSESTSSESSETSESETSATETTVNTEPLKFTHDLSSVSLSNQATDRGYGERMTGSTGSDDDEDEDEVDIIRLTEHCDVYTIPDQKYAQMNEKMEEIFGALKKKYDAIYDTKVSSFADIVKAIPEDEEWLWESMEIDSRAYISRSDSKVLSFSVESYTHFGMDWEEETAYYNFDPVTAEPVSLEKIVTDKQTLADIILSFCMPSTSENYNEDEAEYNVVLTTLSERVRTGDLSKIDFGLTQNDLYLYQEGDSAGELTPYRCIIPALAFGDCLDLSYFTATTEYYTLSSDMSFYITWDFDEDGTVDTLHIENESTGYDVAMKIYYNDQETPYEDYYDSEVTSIMDFYVVHNDDGFCLYILFSKEDVPVYPLHIFHLKDGEFEYVGPFGEFDQYPYDPTCVRLQQRSDLLGTGAMVLTCSLTGNKGFPKETSLFYEKDEIVVTKKDMSIPQTDADGNPNGRTVTIPAGTTVRYFGVDIVTERAFFSTLNQDESKNIEFTMPAKRFSHGIDYEIELNGEYSQDLFIGMNYIV